MNYFGEIPFSLGIFDGCPPVNVYDVENPAWK